MTARPEDLTKRIGGATGKPGIMTMKAWSVTIIAIGRDNKVDYHDCKRE
jgi:hypothetical protein